MSVFKLKVDFHCLIETTFHCSPQISVAAELYKWDSLIEGRFHWSPQISVPVEPYKQEVVYMHTMDVTTFHWAPQIHVAAEFYKLEVEALADYY